MRRYGIRFEGPGSALSSDVVAGLFSETPGLYVHIPFCRTLCPFCPYNKVAYDEVRVARYLDRLEREAALYLDAMPGPFPSLYVGGGTPTLCLDGLENLLARLPVTGERAIEVLPLHMTPRGAQRMRELGFDFVSLGVQSFNRSVLQRLRRPGTPEASRTAIETAVEHFECVDVDLIFDAAYDDTTILFDDLVECFRFGVDQVSTYPLMRFGYTPFGKGRHDRLAEHSLLRAATDLATAHGYERRSVWTFNRQGSPAYTSITRPYFLGLGAGAASFAGRVFFVNHFGLDQYGCALDKGLLPVARIARLSGSAAAAYRSFWQAYTGAVPLHPADPLLSHPVSLAVRELSRLCGWAKRVDDRVMLTRAGYDRYHDAERWVTYHLIEPLWGDLMAEHEGSRMTLQGGV